MAISSPSGPPPIASAGVARASTGQATPGRAPGARGTEAVAGYLFVAIPSWLLGVRRTSTRREHTIQSLTTGALSGVATTPGYLLNRIGLLLLGTALWIVGVVALSIGSVLHITASSSVRVVKMSLRLRPDEQQ